MTMTSILSIPSSLNQSRSMSKTTRSCRPITGASSFSKMKYLMLEIANDPDGFKFQCAMPDCIGLMIKFRTDQEMNTHKRNVHQMSVSVKYHGSICNQHPKLNHLVVSVKIQRIDGVFTCRCGDSFDIPKQILNHSKTCEPTDPTSPAPSSPVAPIVTNTAESGSTPFLNRLSLESVADNDSSVDDALVFCNQQTSHHSSFCSW